MKKMLIAIQFLTIIPVRVRGEVSERDMAGATVFFPAAGAFQGLVMALTAAGLGAVYGPEVVCGFVLLAQVVSSGGFDLDGLADTADAIAVKSSGDASADIAKRLEVMKDSSTGASGAMAIALSLLLKFLLLVSLLRMAGQPVFLVSLILMPAFAKWVTVPAMLHAVPARSDGLGKIFIDGVTPRHAAGSSALLLMISIMLAFALPHTGPDVRHAAVLMLLFLTQYLFCIAAVRMSGKRFGGLTGDTLGAMSEVSEVLFLMVVCGWLSYSAL